MQSIADFRKYVKILEEDSKGSHRPGFILNLKVTQINCEVDYPDRFKLTKKNLLCTQNKL